MVDGDMNIKMVRSDFVASAHVFAVIRTSQTMCERAEPTAAHRHPLARLQTEFHWELEDDGRTGSHLPLQLPVAQVLILMVRHQVSYQIGSVLTSVPASQLSPRQLCC